MMKLKSISNLPDVLNQSFCTMQQYSAVQYSTHYSTVLYNTVHTSVQYCTMQYIVQYSTACSLSKSYVVFVPSSQEGGDSIGVSRY